MSLGLTANYLLSVNETGGKYSRFWSNG
jgi:hypothetical protein